MARIIIQCIYTICITNANWPSFLMPSGQGLVRICCYCPLVCITPIANVVATDDGPNGSTPLLQCELFRSHHQKRIRRLRQWRCVAGAGIGHNTWSRDCLVPGTGVKGCWGFYRSWVSFKFLVNGSLAPGLDPGDEKWALLFLILTGLNVPRRFCCFSVLLPSADSFYCSSRAPTPRHRNYFRNLDLMRFN